MLVRLDAAPCDPSDSDQAPLYWSRGELHLIPKMVTIQPEWVVVKNKPRTETKLQSLVNEARDQPIWSWSQLLPNATARPADSSDSEGLV